MRIFLFFCFLFFPIQNFAQVKKGDNLKVQDNSNIKNAASKKLTSKKDVKLNSSGENSNSISPNDSIAPIDWYKIISSNNYETVVDTALTLKKYQSFNYLGRDMFGLQTLSNDGQAYNVLDFGLTEYQLNPGFGFNSKNYNYYQISDINYYNVPTPFTELTYRSAVKQGQNLNSLFTTNLNERLNLFIGYRGLRSLGAYINELNSIGNFKIGGSYNTKDEKYFLRANVVIQDIMNQENGGITDIDLFESSEAPYNNRERLNVYFRDAKTLYKGTRTFLDHKYKFNKSTENEIWLKHNFYYEYKSNQFEQNELTTFESNVIYFGNSNRINDKVRFKNFYNKLTLAYKSKTLGELGFNADVSNFDYYYNSIVVKNNNEIIPSQINYNLVTIGGYYAIQKEKFSFNAQARQSISNISTTEIKGNINYQISDEYQLNASYQYLSKIPEMTQQMFQSSYVNYNWQNHFSNEKIQSIHALLSNPYVNLSSNIQVLNDKIYFSNDNTTLDAYGVSQQQLITPKQYNKTIGYFNVKAQREFKFGKFALDNTMLFQQVTQDDNILNVPSFITRNTIYYTDKLFKNALFLQTGVTLNYHTKYYANEFNPLISDFFIQDTRKVGGFPTFDFFVNAKIKTARIFLSLDHFNSKFSGNNHFATPTRPFTDMRLRFGIVWDFFN